MSYKKAVELLTAFRWSARLPRPNARVLLIAAYGDDVFTGGH
jgi:hypothetical protein